MIQVFAEPIEKQVDVYKLSKMLGIINKEHISSIGDLEGRIMRLRKEYEKSESEESLKKLRVYQDIKDIYNEISRGDYVSRLVEEEKLRREQENKKQPYRKKLKR
jgi:hypothetical protein